MRKSMALIGFYLAALAVSLAFLVASTIAKAAIPVLIVDVDIAAPPQGVWKRGPSNLAYGSQNGPVDWTRQGEAMSRGEKMPWRRADLARATGLIHE